MGRILQENTGNRRNVQAVFRETDLVTGFIRFRSEPAAEYGHRIPDIFRRVLTENTALPAGFRWKIHGILRQESSSWGVYVLILILISNDIYSFLSRLFVILNSMKKIKKSASSNLMKNLFLKIVDRLSEEHEIVL